MHEDLPCGQSSARPTPRRRESPPCLLLVISSNEDDLWRGQSTEMLGTFARSISSCNAVAGIQEIPNQCYNVWAMI
jgi:hypothetical protein